MDWSNVWLTSLSLASVVALALAFWWSRRQPVVYRYDGAVTDLRQRVEELTLRVIELELGRSHDRVGIARLTAQLIDAGLTPVWAPGPGGLTPDAPGGESQLVRVYQLIDEHFSLDEIEELALTAGIPPESYEGETRPARALSLVQFAARHGRLDELMAACRRARPRVAWPRLIL